MSTNIENFRAFLEESMKANPEEMKPDIIETDGEGQEIGFQMIEGTRMGCFPGLRQRFAELPDVKIRDDDVLIPAFPKSGTQWMWEICTMIQRRRAAPTNGGKMEGFIEFIPPWLLESYASPRFINTHVLPESLPKQILEKKTKLIMMLRNPKDVTVSYYHHTKGLPHYGYKNGTFKGYFELFLNEKNEYGSWFDHTLAWNKFLQTYPKDRQLILYYENVKEDLPKYVRVIAQYLNVEMDGTLADAIADECGFKKMRKANIELTKKLRPINFPTGGEKEEVQTLLRKGEVADWKNNFTVAQNERFDAKIKAKMGECSFKFRFEL